ncbi:MAG: hypothetical protein ACOCV4_02910 [Myxococcota bacterium]
MGRRVGLLGCMVVVGCASPAVPLPASRSVPSSPGPMRGGAATVDVTPPAGLALFGHGPDGRMAAGHRGRLRCRALVLDGGDRVAFVVCDSRICSGSPRAASKRSW